jgi:hypothetical protein
MIVMCKVIITIWFVLNSLYYLYNKLRLSWKWFNIVIYTMILAVTTSYPIHIYSFIYVVITTILFSLTLYNIIVKDKMYINIPLLLYVTYIFLAYKSNNLCIDLSVNIPQF